MALAQQDADTQMEAAANAPDPKTDAPHPMAATQAPPNPLQASTAPAPAASPSWLDHVISFADNYSSVFGQHGKDRLARQYAAGAVNATVNMADATIRPNTPEERAKNGTPNDGPDIYTPIYEAARGALLNVRDALALKDPNIPEHLAYGLGQFTGPFAMFSRVIGSLGGLAELTGGGEAATASFAARAANKATSVAKFAAADTGTNATANAPHDPRMADIVSTGLHAESKFVDLLKQVPGFDGVRSYIDHLADRSNESEADGRWKNVVDGWGVGAAFGGLLETAGGVFKAARGVMHTAADNNIGAMSDLAPKPQSGATGDAVPANPRLDAGSTASLTNEDKIVSKVDADKIDTTGLSMEDEPAAMKVPAGPNNGVTRNADGTVTATSGAFPPVTATPADMSAGITQNQKAGNMLRKNLQTFNEQGGPTPVDADEQRPLGEGVPLNKTISTLNKSLNRNTPQGAFYGEVLDKLQAKNLETKLVPSGTGVHGGRRMDNFGTYDPDSDTMAIHAPVLMAGSNQQVLHTFVHEAVHAATINAVDSMPAVKQQLSGIFEEAERSPAIKALSATDQYGMTRKGGGKDFADNENPFSTGAGKERPGKPMIHEFTAEAFANPRFRAALKASPGEHGTLWDDFKVTIGGILGLSGAALAAPQFDKLLTKENTGA